MSTKKNEHLKYGEGQREQYGEGAGFRPEYKIAAANNMGENSGFAAGGDEHEKGATSRKMADASEDTRAPEENTRPIPPQKSTDPKGTGHDTAKGGLPEKQPTTKDQ